MRIKTKIFATMVLLFVAGGMFLVFAPAQAGCPAEGLPGGFLFFDRPLVPCGLHNSCYPPAQEPCTLCHLLVLVNNIYNLLLSILIIAALLMITIGGTLYIVSSGNSGLKALAKGILTKTLVGFGIFLLSWLIVYTILVFISANSSFLGNGGDHWYEFDCDTDSPFHDVTGATVPGTGTGTGAGGGGTGGTGGAGGGAGGTGSVGNIFDGKTEAEAWQILRDQYNINPWESAPGRTIVKGLRQESIDGVIAFQQEVGASIVMTGAAESGGPHASGDYSHAGGYKVDIDDTAAVNDYIMNRSGYTVIGTRGDGAVVYDDGKGNFYAKESTHWDVYYGVPRDYIMDRVH